MINVGAPLEASQQWQFGSCNSQCPESLASLDSVSLRIMYSLDCFPFV